MNLHFPRWRKGLHRSGLTALAVVGALMTGCPPAELPPLSVEDGCQPLYDGAECLLPYPSDFFMVDDSTMPTGRRIEVPAAAKPYTDEGLSADPNEFWAADGFSTNPTIVFTLPFAIEAPPWVKIFDDRRASETAQHPTVIIEADTGRLIPHFVDEDPRGHGPGHTGYVLHPEVPLLEGTRYVVGVHRLIAARDGQPMPTPAGMSRLVQSQSAGVPALEALQSHYDDNVFPVLQSAGVSREAVQLAFDFTTGSDERTLTDMFQARSIALDWLTQNQPEVEIDAVFEDDAAGWRVIKGTLIGPMVTEDQRPGAELFRNAAGEVVQNGDARFAFTITVPTTVRDGYDPAKVLLYGHGFFGTRSELEIPGSTRVMNALGGIGVAIDWWGLSGTDVGTLINALSGDVSNALLFTDRIPQAMVNWLVMIDALKGPLATEDAFLRPTNPNAPGVVQNPANPDETNAGALLYDPDNINLTGFSLGHILGGSLCALSPDIRRCVFAVGGAGFSHIMYRANPFLAFLFVLDFSTPNPLDHIKVAAMLQAGVDRIDPGRYAPYVLDSAPPFGPESNYQQKRVMMLVGKGDTSVPNFSSFYHARALGLPLVGASPLSPYGIEEVEGPLEGSGLSVYDLGEDDAFYATMFPQEETNFVHDGLRLSHEAQAQMRTFLNTGTIVAPCDAPCVVEPQNTPFSPEE